MCLSVCACHMEVACGDTRRSAHTVTVRSAASAMGLGAAGCGKMTSQIMHSVRMAHERRGVLMCGKAKANGASKIRLPTRVTPLISPASLPGQPYCSRDVMARAAFGKGGCV